MFRVYKHVRPFGSRAVETSSCEPAFTIGGDIGEALGCDEAIGGSPGIASVD